MKKIMSNSLKATLIWIAFNTFFIAVDTINNTYIFGRTSISLTVFNIINFFVIGLLLSFAFVGLYYFGIKALETTRNRILDFISLFPLHILLLCLLYMATKSEHTLVTSITWPFEIVQGLFGEGYEMITSHLNYSFTFGMILSCIPYLIMYIGLLFKSLEKHKEKLQ